ncbi:MAG: class I SAM-dependent methyltransferase [Rubricella sp.]
MSHTYSDTFFDYIDDSASRSAAVLIRLVLEGCTPASILDVGCGRGAWLRVWARNGIEDLRGVDGDYVDRETLEIPGEAFTAADLTRPLSLGRRFDLVQSLEVAEHLSPDASETFVESLTTHGDVILFSAATIGQGGEFHVNERPLTFWRDLFAAHGYAAFDPLRPAMRENRDVAPWYRYNSLLYANEAGQERLSAAFRAAACPAEQPIDEGGDPLWRLRRAVLGRLPQSTVTNLAQLRAKLLVATRG